MVRAPKHTHTKNNVLLYVSSQIINTSIPQFIHPPIPIPPLSLSSVMAAAQRPIDSTIVPFRYTQGRHMKGRSRRIHRWCLVHLCEHKTGTFFFKRRQAGTKRRTEGGRELCSDPRENLLRHLLILPRSDRVRAQGARVKNSESRPCVFANRIHGVSRLSLQFSGTHF